MRLRKIFLETIAESIGLFARVLRQLAKNSVFENFPGSSRQMFWGMLLANTSLIAVFVMLLYSRVFSSFSIALSALFSILLSIPVVMMLTRRLWARQALVFIQRISIRRKIGQKPKTATRKQSEIVSENYFNRNRSRFVTSFIMLFTLGLYLAYIRETGGAIFAFSFLLLLLIHFFVTKFRIDRGLFGSNAQEASEIIQFIVKSCRDVGRPPGSRVSRAGSQEKAKEIRTNAVPEGATP